MKLKGYGTFTYALNQFSHTCPANTGKDSSDVSDITSIVCCYLINYLCSVFCYAQYAQYFALLTEP